MDQANPRSAERMRQDETARHLQDWGRWGPFLSDRQWGTVREDYSADGDAWSYFPHEHARLRAYRWGEDGLLGWCDRGCRLCFSFAFWNGRDRMLKERLFGLGNNEGNHGEDVKELYFFLDGTPSHSYHRALYKYPIAEFPYEGLVAENARRSRTQLEFKIEDSGVFDDGDYFDLEIEYAKASPEDIVMRLTATNRSKRPAPLHVLPTLWFRNTWSWGKILQESTHKPRISWEDGRLRADHGTLGSFNLTLPSIEEIPFFTENETNGFQLFGTGTPAKFTKDAFHRFVVGGDHTAVNPARHGTKAAWWLSRELAPGESRVFDLRLFRSNVSPTESADSVIRLRRAECEGFWRQQAGTGMPQERYTIFRQSMAGLFWSKKFYYLSAAEWEDGDPGQPLPPPGHSGKRNASWRHLFARDRILMPDTWEYPWFAAWDLAFHAVAAADADPALAKEQILLLLSEWYMKNNGQIPAYEWEFSDVNPPVQAWAALTIYRLEAAKGRPDRVFLARVFHKLLLNFTWWVNRKDSQGRNLFSGGFLGLDNIGVFDRSKPLPGGGQLEQADGTAWVGMFCVHMLGIAIELAAEDEVYEDMASKFFEHFVEIIDAMNAVDGGGLWDDQDGFYFDRLLVNGSSLPMRVHSMVGLIPLLATGALRSGTVAKLPGFRKRLGWFLRHKRGLARHVASHSSMGDSVEVERFLALVPRDRVDRILHRLFDEDEFLSPFGIRSLSKVHAEAPFVFACSGKEHRVSYVPGDSDSGLFGGNSNWRGPVWIPLNFLLIGALRELHRFYGDGFRVDFPTRSGNRVNLATAADMLTARLVGLFLPDASGTRPCMGALNRFRNEPGWNDLVLLHEYFHADSGRGLGASHQTGWTALVSQLLRDLPVLEPLK